MAPAGSRKFIAVLSLLLGTFILSLSAKAAPTFADAARPDLPQVARGVPMGGALEVFGLELDQVGPATLELERFAVFAPDVQILVDDLYSIQPPDDAYFRGTLSHLPNSTAVLAIAQDGQLRGLITDASGVWVLAGKSGHFAPGLQSRKVDLTSEFADRSFECGAEGLQLNADVLQQELLDGQGSTQASTTTAETTTLQYTARAIVDTDYEYYAKFNDTNAALAYMGDLFAYSSTVYEREVATNILIGTTRLFTTNSDPYDVNGCCGGTSGALYELRDHWSSSSENRSFVHLLSGKSSGCGCAYLGVLCHNSYGYGVSLGLDGDFDGNNPGIIWDSVVVAHEIGHNFNSPHTHDYCGIGGNTDPVDLCVSSSNCGSALGLPGENSLSGGSTGDRPGTIMSYCHYPSGWFSNLSFTFGKDHIYGVDAFRVPDTMKAHVANRASVFPNCLALQADGPLLTVSKTGAGDGRVTSTPTGIDCGATCSAYFTAGTSVTLNGVENAGSSFIGWGGDCDTNGGVAMDVDKTCTATFGSLCGNQQLDTGELCDGDLFAETAPDCGHCVGTRTCTDSCTVDLSSCYNGVCDPTENCNTCAQDCISGSYGGAECGNGLCEAGNGEDCVSCPSDCNGRTTGKPSNRFCCGGAQACDDSACNESGYQCTTEPAPASEPYCCGNYSCEGPEDGNNCAVDCGAPPPPPVCGDGTCNGSETQCSCATDCGAAPVSEIGSCNDGFDNDCGGGVDCADNDCRDDPVCDVACLLKGDVCTVDTDCCSNKCKGKPGSQTCG